MPAHHVATTFARRSAVFTVAHVLLNLIEMSASVLKGLLTVAVAALALSACAVEDGDNDNDNPDHATSSTDDELRSAPLNDKDMVAINAPAGMPQPWEQPDSTGWFGQRGKCGATALANDLKLFGIELSPDEADKAGVHFLVGTLQWEITAYTSKHHPELGCRSSFPWDGAKAIRGQLDDGHPVMVWFNTDGGVDSHWVVAVGYHGSGADEKVTVMSWGRYYEIPMRKLDDASKWVYGLRHPTVICNATTPFIAR